MWRDAGSGRSGQHFDAELRKLVLLGLAERSGRRGFYRYAITPAGREYLAAIDSNGPGGDSTRPGAVTHTREDPLA